MARKKATPSPRFRVGKVTVYEHHGAWWLYYRDAGKSERRKVAPTREGAEQVAAQINAQLSRQEPTLLAFTPISVAEMRKQFLEYHESVMQSSVGTVRRYRAATQHLENFAAAQPQPPMIHEVNAEAFVTYLRTIEVAPNGHKNTAKRKLRIKGVQYILETTRSLYHYAIKRRHLPPYVGNPFSELPLDRFKNTDAKPIFVFTAVLRPSDWTQKRGRRVGWTNDHVQNLETRRPAQRPILRGFRLGVTSPSTAASRSLNYLSVSSPPSLDTRPQTPQV